MRVRVNVTKTAIRKGLRKQPDACAVARGFRALRYKEVSIYNEDVNVVLNGTRYAGTLPKRAQAFIRSFDHYERGLKPFAFTCTLTPCTNASINAEA